MIYYRFAIGRVLIIAPKKVAEATWQRELRKWDHLKLLRINTVLGNEKTRIRELNKPGDIWIINRENVQWLVDYYRNAWNFDMVVIDESSSFKNRNAKRFKALKWVRGYVKRIVELTGTPAPNGLEDLWAQVYLLDQGQRLGKTLTQYREMYFTPDKRNSMQIFNYKPLDGSHEAIYERISDICISMKSEDYLELPPVTYNDIPVALDAKAKAQYRKLERDMLLEVDVNKIDASTAAVLSNKLLQLCNGAVYDEERNVVRLHDCKIEAFLELAEGLNGQPALVFYNFQHDIDRLMEICNKKKLNARKLMTPQDETDWNDGKVMLLFAHPASAAYGLNLQDGGNHVIWFGLNWSLELYQQANARLHRQGQSQKVIVHHLIVEESRDEDVAAVLTDKAATQDTLIENLKARIEKVKGAVSDV